MLKVASTALLLAFGAGVVQMTGGSEADPHFVLAGEPVRLAWVDLPSSTALCRHAGGRSDRCGHHARMTLRSVLSTARDVQCAPQPDAGADDPLPAVQCTAELEGNRVDLGERMIAWGFGRAMSGAPESYLRAEAEAKAGQAGIWRLAKDPFSEAND